MTKRIMKIIIVLLVILSICLTSLLFVNIKANKNYVSFSINESIDPTTNFFTNKENEELVETVEDDLDILASGYELIKEDTRLNLYLERSTMGIAVYDKTAKYVWYSKYKNYTQVATSDAAKNSIISGVIIECFDSSTRNEARRYSANNKECEISYDLVENGFIAHLNFMTSGISFDVKVTIENDALKAYCDLATLQEVPYQTKAMKFPKEYKLKSIILFPFFGSNNYQINGYSFIPDGSGALIRFEDKAYDTAYIKRVYGNDLGINNISQAEHLKNQNTISLPIYGINHGYQQAAFLTEIKEGFGSTELHSYPYLYENIGLNRTFFKFITRETFNINMASSETGKINFINKDPYHNVFELKYNFLANTDASYVGMANNYKKNFILTNSSKANLKLDVLAQDYKSGLLGKNYITMTKYEDLQRIVEKLVNEDLTNLSINYIGYNNNGYVDNTLKKLKIDSSLGSKKDFNNLVNYLSKQNIKFSLYNNPIVSKSNDLSKKTVKTQNLELFEYYYKSTLDVKGKYINPTLINKYFTSSANKFINKFDIKSFTFSLIGDTSFSYRFKGDFISREEMIKQVVNELTEINKRIEISLEKPNNYLFELVNDYYNASYESSRYAFITDSVPFISLILSGHVNLYSTNINYVSNYDLFVLRLIEYNIYPSFMITNEETNRLRYANFEYLYTTKFSDWHNRIEDAYQKIIPILKNVEGCEMINHKVIAEGIVEITYSNNYKIYVNYTNSDYIYNDYTIPQYGYIGGNA